MEEYIKKPEMVVLVVIPADSDFQNAAPLNMAKQYDPEGNRTLGVVTKVRACFALVDMATSHSAHVASIF